MFDLLTERTDPVSNGEWHIGDAHSAPKPRVEPVIVTVPPQRDGDDCPFRTISVLVMDASGGFPVIEQCLRYMSRFECLITHVGSAAAAEFALTIPALTVPELIPAV
jgi:hypothetical protein